VIVEDTKLEEVAKALRALAEAFAPDAVETVNEPGIPEPEGNPEKELKAGYVSPHFKLSEFMCGCGGLDCNGFNGLTEAEAFAAVTPLAVLLEKGRARINELNPMTGGFSHSVRIVAGFRCKKENTRVGGASGSQHLTGAAADVSTPGLSTGPIWDEVNPNGGVGYGGSNCPHVDVRGHRSRWSYGAGGPSA
jgi:hypothetical protein